MSEHALIHRTIRTNGISMHVAEQGDGPLVLLVHGNPGLWYSWRHQLGPIADAGFRAVAIDSRGYGRTDRPLDAALYDAEQIQADLVGLLDTFGAQRAFVIGQDFGAQAAWNLAVRAPGRVIGVVGMVPYDFDLAGRFCDPASELAHTRPSERFAAIARRHFFHMHYFQAVGPAEAELGARPRLYLERILHALSGRGDLLGWEHYPSDGTGYLDVLHEAPALPWSWLTEADFDYYVNEFTRCGSDLAFVGPLNYYRTADRNWEIGAAWADADIECPALFLCGAEDPVLKLSPPDMLARQRTRLRDLRGEVLVTGAGHFVQQEAARETTDAIIRFLDDIRRERGP